MYQRILVPIDGSGTANLALITAIRLAQASGGRVRVAHVVDEGAFVAMSAPYGANPSELLSALWSNGEKILAEGMAAARAAGVEADCALFDKFGARLGETISDAAKLWNADLVVVGTHGRHGVSRLLLGSGAEQIIRLAPVPVLVIRGEAPAESVTAPSASAGQP